MLTLVLQGLKFPWESALSGREVCPDDVYGQQEIHINGDVTLAFQKYLYLTEVRGFSHPGAISTSGLLLTELCVAGSVRVQGGRRRRAGVRRGRLLGFQG